MDAPALLHLPKTVPHERLPTPTSCAEVSIVEPVIPTIGASRAQSSFAIIGNDLSLDQESLESARDGVRSREAEVDRFATTTMWPAKPTATEFLGQVGFCAAF